MSHILSVLALVLALAFLPVQSHAAADAKAPAGDAGMVLAVVAGENAASADDVAEADGAHDAEAHGTDIAPAAGEEHAEAGLPQLNIGTYPSQIFWLMVAFAVLYVSFSKKILPTIGGVVEARDTLISGNLAAAEALRAEAENVRVSYEKNLEQARVNAMKAIQDVEAAAKQKAADQAEAFRKKTDEGVKDAEARVGSQKDKAMGDMKQVAAEVASVAAEKITGINTDVQKAKAIVDSIADKAKAA